jgi:hypothetical protein
LHGLGQDALAHRNKSGVDTIDTAPAEQHDRFGITILGAKPEILSPLPDDLMQQRIGAADEIGEIAADVVAIGDALRHRLLLRHELIGEPTLLASPLRTNGIRVLKIEVTASILLDLHAQPRIAMVIPVHRVWRKTQDQACPLCHG